MYVAPSYDGGNIPSRIEVGGSVMPVLKGEASLNPRPSWWRAT